MSDLERLLEASIEYQRMKRMLVEVTEELAYTTADNERLRRELGRWRLLADMRQDQCALLRRQAG
jgi:regulator of replication initiation timing